MTGDSFYETNKIVFSVGQPHNLGKSRNTTETIRKFKDRFRSPTVTPEKFREYVKASDQLQRQKKGVAGWFMRCPVVGGVRSRDSLEPSHLITLDIDYATPEYVEQVLAGEVLSDYALIAHSSRSHTPEKPRLRIIIFLEGTVSADRYGAASRIIAQLADPNMEYVDKVSFRPAQMMYLPTCSKDMEKHYVFYEQHGALLDHEAEIETWELTNGSSYDIANLPKAQGEDDLRVVAEKAEDPLEKQGPVGDFCRAWSITELVMGKDGEEGPLADVYEPVEWANGVISRMTYKHGSTSNGAVVYDDKFIFSHHGSDPTQEQLVNAFDAVRLHLYGDEDKGSEPDTPLKDLPSSKKMREFLLSDSHYRQQQAESRYDIESKLLDDEAAEYEDEADDDGLDGDEEEEIADLIGSPREDTHRSRRRAMNRDNWIGKPPKKWIAKKLELTDEGAIKVTMHNIAFICLYDPRLWRKIAYNQFSSQVVMLGDFRSKSDLIPTYKCKDSTNGDRWQEINDIIIRAILDAPSGKGKVGYGTKVGKEMIHDAVRLAAQRNSFHPIIEFLDSVSADENVEPVDCETMFIKFFGCPDTPYYRELGKLVMVASVARVLEPGCKFDYGVILEGAQGIGKSSAVRTLYGDHYFGEIDVDLKDRKAIAEQIAGKWVLELPELSAMHKSESNDAKAFMSRQHDDVRLSYDRNVSELPRQCVVWGTTNDDKYLRDTTGGRRYLPAECGGQIDIAGLSAARSGLWKDAMSRYLQMRQDIPYAELPLYLTGVAASTAKRLQERARKAEAWELWLDNLMEWADEPISLRALLMETGREADTLDESYEGYDLDRTMVQRIAFTQKQAIKDGLAQYSHTPNSSQAHTFWTKVLSQLVALGWKHPDNATRIGGTQRRFIVRPKITKDEQRLGFRVVDPAHAQDSADAQVDDTYDDLL